MSVLDDRLETTSRKEALAAMRSANETIRVQGIGPEFVWSQTARGDERFALRRWRFRSTQEYTGSATVTRGVAVAWAPKGVFRWSAGAESGVSGDPFLPIEGRRVDAQWSSLDLRLLCLEQPALDAVARSVYNDDALTVRFPTSHPVSAAMGAHWASTVRMYYRLFRDPAVLRSAPIRASAFRHLAVVTMEAFRMGGDLGGRRESAAGLSTAYRRARAFIDDHASLPITLDDIAEAAHVTPLELDRAFDSHSTGSPSARLREARLEGAHQDLVKGDPTTGETVREIAINWGFAYPGDFARAYRARFGRTPKWTLDR